MAVELTESETRAIKVTSLEDIYASLALTEKGNAGSAGIVIGDVSSIHSIMNAEGEGAEHIIEWLAKKGRELFETYWPQVKAEICRLYTGEDPSDVKAWIEQAATIILGLINITAAAAVFVAVLALKMGLNHLCVA